MFCFCFLSTLSLMMELNKEELQSLVEKAWGLHGRLNGETKKSINFCRICPEHGRNFHIAQTPFDDSQERLTAIRDSLKEVEDNLIFLQSLRCWQVRKRHAALTHLEGGRLSLIELVKQYQGRELDVVRELNASFGNENAEKLKKKMAQDEQNVDSKRRLSCCNNVVGKLFVPWKWQSVVDVGFKFLIVSASLLSMFSFYHTGRLSSNSRRKIPLVFGDSQTRPRKITLDVFYGRG